jgi:hypothetical protein
MSEAGGGQVGTRPPPPDYVRSAYPISTGWTDYAPTLLQASPDFQTFPHPWAQFMTWT